MAGAGPGDQIDSWKNRGLDPAHVPAGESASFANGKGAPFYKAYQERLKTLNAADFGDLLLESLRLFRENGDVLAEYLGGCATSWSTNTKTPTSSNISGCG